MASIALGWLSRPVFMRQGGVGAQIPRLARTQVWRFPDVEIIIQSVQTVLNPLLLERIYGTV